MRKKIFTFLLALVASVGMSWATTTDLASITGNYTAQDGETLTGTLGVSVKISIADGATVTLLNANINGDKTLTTGEYAGLTCLGDATITIVGTNSVSGFKVGGTYGFPGIYVPSGKTLIINGTGSLTAQSSSGYAAGIGALKDTHCGNIEIQSGKITAIAGERGAGIGGSNNANCGNITISGGIVTAVGGYQCSGIGGGRRGGSTNAGHCGNILISGGVVSATSGENAAAIGGGRGYNNSYKSNCGTITITNTALKVYAEQGGEKGSTNTIGAGKNGNNVTVTIGGNTGVINDDPYTYRTKEDGEIVVDYINAIGSVVYTQECKDKIDIARELYDALEASQIDLVTNYQTLLDAEAAYAALIPQPVVVTANTLQLHVNDALMGSVAVTNLLGSGIVDNGDGTYDVPEGAEVTLHATPNEGYEFIGWKASSSICDFNECEFVALPTNNNPLTFDMYNEAAFMAEFAAVASQPAEDVNITPNVDPDHAGVYYSTFFDSANKYALPAGVEAYVATRDGANLLLSKIAGADQTIPANNAVILKATVTPFTLTPSDAEAVPVNAINHLQGTDVSIATPDNCYVLAGTNGVGFYHYTAPMLNPHKAYVIYSGSQAPKRMPFIFDQATGIDNASAKFGGSEKILENGVLYIIKNGVKYNVQGQEVK